MNIHWGYTIIFSPQWWLAYELAKVKNEKRRRFLHDIFSAPKGWDKFVSIREKGKGAKECEKGGVWERKLTIPRKRPCAICIEKSLIKFTPWGELFEDHLPICIGCIRHLLGKSLGDTPDALMPEDIGKIITKANRLAMFHLIRCDLSQERAKLHDRLNRIEDKLTSYGL